MEVSQQKKKKVAFFLKKKAFEIYFFVFSSTFPVKIKEAIDAC